MDESEAIREGLRDGWKACHTPLTLQPGKCHTTSGRRRP